MYISLTKEFTTCISPHCTVRKEGYVTDNMTKKLYQLKICCSLSKFIISPMQSLYYTIFFKSPSLVCNFSQVTTSFMCHPMQSRGAKSDDLAGHACGKINQFRN